VRSKRENRKTKGDRLKTKKKQSLEKNAMEQKHASPSNAGVTTPSGG